MSRDVGPNNQHPKTSRWLILATWLTSWALVLEAGLALRVIAADAIQWRTQKQGLRCVFSDTNIYWDLASSIRRNEPFETFQWGVPHQALRTPGYPLFLATCQILFGEHLLAPRLIQAGLGACGALIVFAITRRLFNNDPGQMGIAWTAAWLTALDPFGSGLSVLLLSEGLFIPLMLVSLWALAQLWETADSPKLNRRQQWRWALILGSATGAAILVRPSWLLFPLAISSAWLVFSSKGHRGLAAKRILIAALTAMVVMSPWWIRNYKQFGRFVPTALWMGASLYDGLNPKADGSSQMEFLDDPAFWGLTEIEQDRVLVEHSIAFIKESPGRALELALIKAARFWSPWPNAAELRSPALGWLSASIAIPSFLLLALGVYDRWRRRDFRTLVVLGGPLLYFFVLHMIFVSSIRYRIPGMIPAFGLVAFGAFRIIGISQRRA